MAENKKSFVLYTDSKGLVNQLPDDVAGRLFKHIYAYVNDENPVSDELLLNVAFEPIKQQLKRDLVKWENQLNQRKEAGKKSAEVRATKMNERSTVVESRLRKSTDNVNVSVNENVTVNDIKETQTAFAKKLLANELEKEAIETSAQKKLTPEILKQFNAHCINTSKNHQHYSEWKKHLASWFKLQKDAPVNKTHKLLT